jgi:hypothetical protein
MKNVDDINKIAIMVINTGQKCTNACINLTMIGFACTNKVATLSSPSKDEIDEIWLLEKSLQNFTELVHSYDNNDKITHR